MCRQDNPKITAKEDPITTLYNMSKEQPVQRQVQVKGARFLQNDETDGTPIVFGHTEIYSTLGELGIELAMSTRKPKRKTRHLVTLR